MFCENTVSGNSKEVYFGSFCLPRLEIFGYSHFPGILGRLSHENQSHIECLVVRFVAENRHFFAGTLSVESG